MTALLRAAFVCAIVAFGSSAQAQTPEDPAETARFRWGPIRFTPTLEVNSVGRDSNVFNEVEDPKSDFTAAIGPAVRLWVRPLGTRLSVTTGGQYLYFKEYADQRAWNTNNELKWEVPLARITPFVAGTFINSRERQGYEIDARARRRDRSYTLGSSLRLGGKTELVGSFRRAEMDYDDQETPFGAILADELNRREDSSTLQFRYALTPLTTFVTNVAMSRDRFDMPNIRDSDSLEIVPGFELKPLALISGNVFVGYKRFEPLDTTLTEYAGVVAAVKAKYTYSATRFEIDVNRDVAYSFEATQPYYALLDYGLTVTERVAHRWELVGQASLQRLAYTAVETSSTPVSEPERTDRGRQFGAGIGYRLNETVRIGFNAYRVTRKSSQEARSFEGTRIFGSVTYGIQQ